MPVLHSYTNKHGFYIRSRVDGNPITFQVSPAGAEVLQDLGYHSESDIPWSVLRPLYNQGDVYTENSGVDDMQIEDKQTTDLSHLTKQQRNRLQTYLNQEELDISIHEIRKRTQEVLGLSMVALAKRKLETLTISPALAQSLDNFIRLPYQSQDLTTPSVQDVAYEFHIEDTTFRCIDSRWRNDSRYDFKISTATADGEKQILHIRDGYLTRLYVQGEQQQSGDSITERHSSIYREADRLTEIRKLFFHLPHYDIRPDPQNPGHKKLASGSELIGSHIWVTPERYTASQKTTKNKLVTCELKNIVVHTDTWEQMLVEVTNKNNSHNTFFGERVDQRP